jgi:hypothetical protein
VDTLWVSILGVVGTLVGTVVGAFVAQRLQRRATESTQLRQERLTAYSAFAAAMIEFRRAQTDRAFRRGRQDATVPDGEFFPAKGAAWSAYYRVRFLAGCQTITDAAELAIKAAGAEPQSDDEAEREQLAHACRKAVDHFVDEARRDIQPRHA